MALIRFEEAYLTRSGAKAPTLQDIGFAIDPGETLVVMGGCGSGKSTLAQWMAGWVPHATPAATGVPEVWLLGSSDYSAQLAAHIGLPYVFANHFSGDGLERALEIYRKGFQPSEWLAEPATFLTINAVAAPIAAQNGSSLEQTRTFRHLTKVCIASVFAVDPLTTFVPLLSLHRQGRRRASLQTTQPDRLAGILTVAVGAVLDPAQRIIDLGDQLALPVASPKLQRAIGFR